MRQITIWGVLLLSLLLFDACTTETVSTHIPEKNLPRAAMINLKLGLIYLQQGDVPKAKQKLLLAQRQHPSAAVIRGLAYFYEKTGDLSRADVYYRKAIAKAPLAGAGHNNYGVFLCKAKRYRQAEQQFVAAITDINYLNIANAYENAGLCALLIPDDSKAKRYFKKALQQNPNIVTSLRQLIRLNYEQRRYQQANVYLQHYLNIRQLDADTLWLGAQMALKLNDKAMWQRCGALLATHFPRSTQFAQYQRLMRDKMSDR